MHLGAWSLAVGLGLAPVCAGADSIDGRWRITGFVGEAWFVDPTRSVGRLQSFSGGYADGPLYGCDAQGQSGTYTTYSNDGFFANPKFGLFGGLRSEMTRGSGRIFVHRITCDGLGNLSARRVLYPFVTNESRRRAWYLYEGGIFTLTRE